MPWLAAIGGAVAGVFGATAISTGVAMLIGGAVVGAAVGALYTAVQGGSLGKNMLYGALGGAALGFGGSALGIGGPATGWGGASIASTATTSSAITSGAGWTAGGILGTTGATVVPGAVKSGASLFANAGWMQGAGNIASLGAAFLHGGQAGEDRDADLAFQEKKLAEQARQADQQLALQEKTADQSFEASMKRIDSAESIASSNLEEDARQFDETIGFRKYEYEDAKEEAEKARQRHEGGILKASEYVKGNTKTASISDQNKQRRQLPGPVWYDSTRSQEQPQQTNGILQTGATT